MATAAPARARQLAKVRTGIKGLDEITGGGLPRGRPTLVCGGPGCGKTLLATEFLVRGAAEFGEPGVFLSFEESAADLTANVRSLGFDLDALVAKKQLRIDFVRVERAEIEETGDYDLEGLFVRLGYAIDAIGARRVVLDTLESLFSGFTNEVILRAELVRLFRWLKDRQVTAVVTGESGREQLTRHGLEEYISDCVLVLDHRVDSQVSTRRLRIVKYRGSTHGTNEYPFLIDEGGFTVVPITSVRLDHPVSDKRVSTGMAGLDEMLGGKGVFRGTTVLITGTAGTGKTITSACFADAACRRGERTLFFSFEESAQQIERNMRSVGLDLKQHVAAGLLRFHTARATLYGLEAHLARMLRDIDDFRPAAVIIDPVTSLLGTAGSTDVDAMVTRLLDLLKERGITTLMTSLTSMLGAGPSLEFTDVGISSLVDTWILLRDIELGGERNRGVYVLKSRGMAHSNQIREFLITSAGVRLEPAYLGPEGVLTGSMRVAQEARAATEEAARADEMARAQARFERKRAATEAQIAALRADLEAEQLEVDRLVASDARRQERARAESAEIARRRHAAPSARAQGPKSNDGRGGGGRPKRERP